MINKKGNKMKKKEPITENSKIIAGSENINSNNLNFGQEDFESIISDQKEFLNSEKESEFDAEANFKTTSSLRPLADRMRPQTIEDFVGQTHVVGKDKLLYRSIKAQNVGSSIFYGPPGTGKTTLAGIIAKSQKANFEMLNAVSSGVADAKRIIEKAKIDLELYGKKTYLLLDECHRWSKAQSDCVLSAIEKGYIIFIGSTTENPFFSMTKAIISRCKVYNFKPIEAKDIEKVLKKALTDPIKGLGNYKIEIEPEALKHFSESSNGDVRNALNSLELAVKSTDSKNGVVKITAKIAEECTGGKLLSIDEDMYYDMLSAFCKSLRGTDPDSAVYWAFRLIESGVDPLVILRRLIAHSSEDVGIANSNALVVATSALTAYQSMGVPEGLIPLTHAIIYTATSPKSNSVITAMQKAQELAKSSTFDAVPAHLKNNNFMNEKRSKYLYPHSFGGYVKQQYLPDKLKNEKIYIPTENGNEKKVKEMLNSLKNSK